MKTKILLAILFMANLVFISCNKDDDSFQPTQTVDEILKQKYPKAEQVKWEKENGHQIATFYLDGKEHKAYFDQKEKWIQTISGTTYKELPEAVTTGFQESDYKDWKVGNTYKYELPERIAYRIEVKSGEKEAYMLLSPEGKVIENS